MTYGNGLAEARAFNDRLQPTELRTYNPSTGSDIAKFTYGFYDGSGRNNGNVMSMMGQGTGITNFNRSYTYDELNRLKTMTGTGGACTGLSWSYDIWGNRTNQTPTGGTCSPSSLTFDTNNRITGSGYQYDAAGNVTYDSTTNSTLTYDAESRVIAVSGTLGNVTYVYDALGRRTARQIVGGDRTRFLYDMSGNVVAEWLSGSWTGWAIGYVYANGQMLAQYRDNTTHFAVKDHLGSTRAITRLDQSVLAIYDYLPFGGESSGAWPMSHKFTGFERDAESGLDHTLFRKYSSSIGRWLSPDPLAGSRGNPQSLNRYTYVLNSPTNFSDPLGLCPTPRVERTRDWYCRIGGVGGGKPFGCLVDGISSPCSFGDRFGTGVAVVPCPNNVCDGVNSDGLSVTFVANQTGAGYVCIGPGTHSSQQAAGTAAVNCANDISMGMNREYYGYGS